MKKVNFHDYKRKIVQQMKSRPKCSKVAKKEEVAVTNFKNKQASSQICDNHRITSVTATWWLLAYLNRSTLRSD